MHTSITCTRFEKGRKISEENGCSDEGAKYFTRFPSLAVISSLSNLSVRIPEYLQQGETADLTCSYNLGGDTLYSVKWYKGRHEFYRFMPHEVPAIKTFPVKGMKINVSWTN